MCHLCAYAKEVNQYREPCALYCFRKLTKACIQKACIRGRESNRSRWVAIKAQGRAKQVAFAA
jgi:hypothetical protein